MFSEPIQVVEWHSLINVNFWISFNDYYTVYGIYY
jgi:hypothetical protein